MAKVTEDMVSDWVGNHGDMQKREAWMLETLAEIANGKYAPEHFKDEVLGYNE